MLSTKRKPRFDDYRLSFKRMAHEAEIVTQIQHAPVFAQHMAEDFAHTARMPIVDQLPHQRIAKPMPVQIAAHNDGKLRPLAVRVF